LKQAASTKRLGHEQIKNTLDHGHGVGNLEDGSESLVWNETMCALQIHQVFCRSIGSHKVSVQDKGKARKLDPIV